MLRCLERSCIVLLPLTTLGYIASLHFQVLVEMLRHLKRSYWPFPWDSGADAQYPGAVGSHGGFRCAAGRVGCWHVA